MVQVLRQRREHEEARLVAKCQVEFGAVRPVDAAHCAVDLTLRCNWEVLKRLTTTSCFELEPEAMRQVGIAVRACLPGGYWLGNLEARAASVPVSVAGKRQEKNKVARAAASAPGPGKAGPTVPQRVFELLRSLRLEPGKRKAPLHTVFEFAVLDGLSGIQVAQRCGCVPSLITDRLKTIEDRFRMSIDRLRSYAAEIRDIETVVRGNRTVRKKDGDPRGATGESDGDGEPGTAEEDLGEGDQA